MSEDLFERLRIANSVSAKGMSLFIQLNQWQQVSKLALKENNEAEFDKACKWIDSLEGRIKENAASKQRLYSKRS